MYIRKTDQIKFSDDFFLPFGGKLNKDNRWVKLAEMIPWSDFEDAYARNFKSSTRGEEAFSVRVALGTLILQTRLIGSGARHHLTSIKHQNQNIVHHLIDQKPIGFDMTFTASIIITA